MEKMLGRGYRKIDLMMIRRNKKCLKSFKKMKKIKKVYRTFKMEQIKIKI